VIAEADGSCNSWEKKYRYRNQERTCPKCGKESIIKSKRDPGYYCFPKLGGCGANFTANDPDIVNQQVGQIKNPDIADLPNTILKQSQKRSMVAVTLIATGASDYFTQDIEDYITGELVEPAPAVTKTTAQPAPPSGPEWVPELDEDIEPAPREYPNPSATIALETAKNCENSKHVRYGDMAHNILDRVWENIEKALTVPNLTEERLTELKYKRDAALTVLRG
jgi:predicted RNA-binding Zn-ribbon protein involved in translation (DUF1610 family)